MQDTDLKFLELTSEDGLVNAQGGGLDGNNPDVSRDFVTNCGVNISPCHFYEIN